MKHTHRGGWVVSPERIAVIENEIEELFERIENIEKQMKDDRKEQLKKLKAEADYAKLCRVLANIESEK